MSSLCLVADDLTGALDSAVQFTGQFGPIPVRLCGDDAAPSGTVAFDLNCRDLAEGEAVRRTRAVAERLDQATMPFKKIDSLLRGHWAAELKALADLGLFARIVLAPAFPAQGRITHEGRQFVRTHDAGWMAVPVDPGLELRRHGLATLVTAEASAASPAATPVLLCDAVTDSDLGAIVARVGGWSGTTLWCGSAGLARALASAPPRVAEIGASPHLVVVGSNHAVTLAQIEHLRHSRAHGLTMFDDDADASAKRIAEGLARHTACVAMADLPHGIGPAAARDRIARRLTAILPRIPAPGTLTVVGGETFAALCRALVVATLDVEGEWRPGVPASRLRGGSWDGTRCFSKSGAFGEAPFMVDLLGPCLSA